MKELQKIRNEILTLRNYGVINKQEEKSLLTKLNALKEAITVTHCCKSDSEQLINFLEFLSKEGALKNGSTDLVKKHLSIN